MAIYTEYLFTHLFFFLGTSLHNSWTISLIVGLARLYIFVIHWLKAPLDGRNLLFGVLGHLFSILVCGLTLPNKALGSHGKNACGFGFPPLSYLLFRSRMLACGSSWTCLIPLNMCGLFPASVFASTHVCLMLWDWAWGFHYKEWSQ